jgi:hypothetical protein
LVRKSNQPEDSPSWYYTLLLVARVVCGRLGKTHHYCGCFGEFLYEVGDVTCSTKKKRLRDWTWIYKKPLLPSLMVQKLEYTERVLWMTTLGAQGNVFARQTRSCMPQDH